MQTFDKMNVYDLIHTLTDEELGKLYTALLRIDEVNLLGDGNLKKLFQAVDDEGHARECIYSNCLNH